jgi:hypothetical protein
MGEPTQQLRGHLRAQDRYGALVAVVGNRPTRRRQHCWCCSPGCLGMQKLQP